MVELQDYSSLWNVALLHTIVVAPINTMKQKIWYKNKYSTDEEYLRVEILRTRFSSIRDF